VIDPVFSHVELDERLSAPTGLDDHAMLRFGTNFQKRLPMSQIAMTRSPAHIALRTRLTFPCRASSH